MSRALSSVAVAIKTIDRAPRGAKNYLGDTLHNLERSGGLRSSVLSSLVIVDSGSPDFDAFITGSLGKDFALPPYIPFWARSGTWTLHQCAQRAIATAAGDAHAEWVLVLEDDLDFCANFLESVVAWLIDHARDSGPVGRMYAFGANYSQIQSCLSTGEWLYPVSAFYGAQALAWRRDDAQQLAEWLGPDPHKGGVRSHGHDLLLQDWGNSLGLTHFLASAPSFVQHIGEQSGIGNRTFQFATWPGRDWTYLGQQR